VPVGYVEETAMLWRNYDGRYWLRIGRDDGSAFGRKERAAASQNTGNL